MKRTTMPGRAPGAPRAARSPAPPRQHELTGCRICGSRERFVLPWTAPRMMVRGLVGRLCLLISALAVLIPPAAVCAAPANPHGLAVVIGNKSYTHADVPPVDYAHRDAAAFKRYVVVLAARGSTDRGTCVPRTASGTPPVAGTTSPVSELPERWIESCFFVSSSLEGIQGRRPPGRNLFSIEVAPFAGPLARLRVSRRLNRARPRTPPRCGCPG